METYKPHMLKEIFYEDISEVFCDSITDSTCTPPVLYYDFQKIFFAN